jgi:hypothetical protein
MNIKQEYNIKDRVWIHIGERNLVEGRVVEIITLDHLNENHQPGHELYVIEIKTGIDDIYEVRDFLQTSPDSKGPIMCYRDKDLQHADRYLRKVGIAMPTSNQNLFDILSEEDEPTPDQIHAALEKAERGPTTIFKPNEKPANKKPRRRTFTKRKKNDSVNS